MFLQVHHYFEKLSSHQVQAINILFILVLGLIDHLTGSELSFSVFYLLPVFIATWYAGNKREGIATSCFAAIVWMIADFTAGHVYSNVFIPIWNGGVRLVFFMVLSRLLWIIKEKLKLEESLADTDSLTGLANRRAFMERLDLIRHRSKRFAEVFTITYLDLDNFKVINDTQGHLEGDRVLQAVALSLSLNIREVDQVARLGGDEFAIIFSSLDQIAAKQVLAKVHRHLMEVMSKKSWPITFSIGSITFTQPMETSREMIRAVDDLMYQVKKTGKNNLAFSSWPESNSVNAVVSKFRK